jgi:hypothetical protein
MQDKIRVLFLASDPFRDGARLRLDREVRAIRGGIAREGVELTPYFAASTRDLQTALLLHEPQIVHFAGQGPGIYLSDASGRPGAVGKDALSTLFGVLSEWVKVVILNGSGTLPFVHVLGEVVDHAIGMDQPLGDTSAIVFARAFYDALGTGKTVQASFDHAVRRLEVEGSAGSALPMLRSRPDMDPAMPLAAEPGGTAPPTSRRWSPRAAR